MSKLRTGKYQDRQGFIWIFQNEVEKRLCFLTNEKGGHMEAERLHQKMVREDNPEIVDWYKIADEGGYWY